MLLAVLPVTVFAGLDMLCRGEFPAVLRPLRRALRRLPGRPAVSRPRKPVVVDVFDTLRVQSRLGAVADEILRLESDRSVFARASRLRAALRAYDDLLTEACRLAGVRLDAVGPVDYPFVDAAREKAELELASRGWSW